MFEYAKKLGKRVISAILLGITLVGSYLLLVRLDGSVVFCNPQGECIEFTPQEYLAERSRLWAKVKANQPLEWEEYQLYVRMYDHEIRKAGGVQFQNLDLKDNKGRANLDKLDQALGL